MGHDFRGYSASVKMALTSGLMAAGCKVHDIGLALQFGDSGDGALDSGLARHLAVEEGMQVGPDLLVAKWLSGGAAASTDRARVAEPVA